MIDVAVIFTNNNKRFKIVRIYDGFELFQSGAHKNMENTVNHADKIIKKKNYRVGTTVYR